MTPNGSAVGALSEDEGDVEVMRPFSCDACHRLSLAKLTVDRGYAELTNNEQLLEEHADVLDWLPPAAEGRSFPDVPKHIAAAANEVHECLSIGAARAALILARAVVEGTCKDQGHTSGALIAKIDALNAAGKIRELTRLAAHEVRLDGNEVAHGDLVAELITRAEAAEVVALMDEVLSEIYQGPARVARVRASRAARHGAPAGPTA